MNEYRTLRISKDKHDKMLELAKRTKRYHLNISDLTDIAVTALLRMPIETFDVVRKSWDEALNKLSNEICPIVPAAPKPDEYDKLIDQSVEAIKKEPKKGVAKRDTHKTPAEIALEALEEIDSVPAPKPQEIKVINSTSPATRVDEVLASSAGIPEIDINDILAGE